MDKEHELQQILEIKLAAGNGAEKIIQKIAVSSLREKLLLRDDRLIDEKWYREHFVNYLEFFSPKEGLADTIEVLENLFPLESLEDGLTQEISHESGQEEKECRIFLYQKQEEKWDEGGGNPRIQLKIVMWPFQIPFALELIPYDVECILPEEKLLEGALPEKVSYCMFTAEEYLSRSFYHIIDDLELVYSMSWYSDCYDILTERVVEGRKVCQSLEQLLLEYPIPLLEERLEMIASFEDYEYMEKRWENYRKGKSFPEWKQVLELLMRFFTPILEVILKDEVFIGDWMPQIGRYLD